MSCRVDGCDRPVHVKKSWLCQTHYLRLRRWGSTDKHKVPAPVTVDLVLERGKVEKIDGDCWLWHGTLRQGYGVIGVGGRTGKVWQAHRLMYELVRGQVPDGLVLHHECHERRCVNPDHLSAITRREHVYVHADERRVA